MKDAKRDFGRCIAGGSLFPNHNIAGWSDLMHFKSAVNMVTS